MGRLAQPEGGGSLRVNPKITVTRGKVRVDGKALKELVTEFGWSFPSENVLSVGPLGHMASFIGLPAETYHVYVFTDPADRDAYGKGVRDGSVEMLLFRLPTRFIVGTAAERAGPIHEIWARDRGRAAKGMIAVARVFRYPEETYVDMMSVRPTARHNRVNAALIATVLKIFPGKLSFSKATPDGAKFIEWLGTQGVPVKES